MHAFIQKKSFSEVKQHIKLMQNKTEALSEG